MSSALRPSVTVVIAAHAAASTLGAAVRSACAQHDVDQVVVVDDASDDDTASVAEGLAAQDPRVEVIRRGTRGGPCVARDEGLSFARARRVCFLDADDELLDGALASLGDALDAAPGAVVAMGRFAAVGVDGAPADVGRWSEDQLRPVVRRAGALIESPEGMTPEALVTRLVSPPPGAWLVDAAALRAVGGFDVEVARSEDLELLVRLAFAGRIVTVDREVLRYLRHPSQRSAAVSRRRWGRGHAMWRVLRAAPGARERRALARGMSAYQRSLSAPRLTSGSWRVRAMGARNLAGVAAAHAMGAVATALPQRRPVPLAAPRAGAVD